MRIQGISGLDGAQTIMDLTSNIPDIISDLLGYSVVPQQLQENQLLAGDMFNTTNVVKTGSGVNGVPAYIPIEIKTTSDMTQVPHFLSLSLALWLPNSDVLADTTHACLYLQTASTEAAR